MAAYHTIHCTLTERWSYFVHSLWLSNYATQNTVKVKCLKCTYENFPRSTQIFDHFFHPLLFCCRQKVKGLMFRNDAFGDGVGRFMDFPSVRPWRGARYNSHVTLATLCSYPTQNNIALISILLSTSAMWRAAQKWINFVVLSSVLGAEMMIWNT